MAKQEPGTTGVRKTLGLTGVTVNAMALIAPGAFLWITFQLQAAATAPSGASVASDMWFGILAALIVAFMATLLGYIYTAFTGDTLSNPVLCLIAIIFAFLTGYVAYRGITGSTFAAVLVNVVQIVSLVGFSVLAIAYRMSNPQQATQWAFSGGWDVVLPHSFVGVLVQS